MSYRSILGACVFGLAMSLLNAGEQQLDPSRRRVDPPGPGNVITVPSSDRREWSDAAALERWSALAPQSALRNKMKKPIRTAHYVVLTDSSCAETFGKRMEAHYARIREILGLDAQTYSPRMPIFLFRTPEEYYAFVVAATPLSNEQARATGGIAYGEWYATWYESPCDSVHVSGAVRQILNVRMPGARGAWFMDGIAEYAATSRNDRNAVANRVAREKAMSLAELTRLDARALVDAKCDGTTLNVHERQIECALFIEFLRDGAFCRKGYPEFMRAIAAGDAIDPPALDKALRAVYGAGLHDVEKLFVDYCKGR